MSYKMKTTLKSLEQEFDYAAYSLMVYQDLEGIIYVTEKINGHGMTGRIFKLQTMFELAKDAAREKEFEKETRKLEEKVQRLESNLTFLQENFYKESSLVKDFLNLEPRFGWKK